MARLTPILRRFRLVAVLFALALVAGACATTATTVDVSTDGGAASAASPPDSTDLSQLVPVDDPVSAPEIDESTSEPVGSIADEVISFDATPAFLAMAAEQVEQAESVRFEMFIEVDSLFAMGSRTEPFATGQKAGNQAQMTIDMGAMLGGLADAGSFDASNLAMDLIVDTDAAYMRAPFFAEMLGGGASLGGEFAWIDALATGWGKISFDAGGDAGVVEDFTNLGGLGADEMIDMLRQTGDVQDGGAGEVRGVPTQILNATVALDDLIGATGQSTENFGLDDPLLGDGFAQTTITMQVHVDEAGQLRRVEYEMDFGELFADDELGGVGMSMWQRMDFFGYGDPIEITIPSDAVDITDDLAALEALGGF